MKKMTFVILICLLSIGSFELVRAGEIRVYDYDNQYIGVLMGETNLTIYSDTFEKLDEKQCFRVLIPTLNKTVNIDTFSGNLVQNYSLGKMANFVNGDPAEYVQVSLSNDL